MHNCNHCSNTQRRWRFLCISSYVLTLLFPSETSYAFHPHHHHPKASAFIIPCYNSNHHCRYNNDGSGGGIQYAYTNGDAAVTGKKDDVAVTDAIDADGSLSNLHQHSSSIHASRRMGTASASTTTSPLVTTIHDEESVRTSIQQQPTRRRYMIGSLWSGWMTTAMIPTPASQSANSAALTTSSTTTTTTTSSSTTDSVSLLSQRLQTSILQQPTIGSTTYNSMGNDMTVYPYYMAGTWNVTQTLINVETPLGLQYAGGPNGIIDIARKSIQESQLQIGKPVNLQLRYIPCRPLKNSDQRINQNPQTATTTTTDNDDDDENTVAVIVLEDRLYNTRQRLNQFAGTNVVANVQYADTQASNQKTMNALYECRPSITSTSSTSKTDHVVPLTTTLTYFKGPAAQKVFVLGHHDARTAVTSLTSSILPTTWTGYEYQRSIFALTNESTAPPITTDTELIFQFTPIQIDDTTTSTSTSTNNDNIHHIRGKLRIAGYLNPNDKYYFDVQNRAVTIQDYRLDMKRIS
jgi:hypothetical protein